MFARAVRVAAATILASFGLVAAATSAHADDATGPQLVAPAMPAPSVVAPPMPSVEMPELPELPDPGTPSVAAPQLPETKADKHKKRTKLLRSVPAMPDYPSAPSVKTPDAPSSSGNGSAGAPAVSTDQAGVAVSDNGLRSPQELLAQLEANRAPAAPNSDVSLAVPQAASQPEQGLPLGTIGTVAGIGALVWFGSSVMRRHREARADAPVDAQPAS